MRVRDHAALSSGAAVLLYPRLRGSVLVPWAASIFIDVDHYLWFLVKHRRLNPAAAVRAFNGADAPKHPATRPLHHPAILPVLLLLSKRRRPALLAMMGMSLHIVLDRYHRARMADAQAAALNRDHRTCQVCGGKRTDVVAHTWRQPAILPSYQLENFVTLCPDCHEAAHQPRAVAIVRPGCEWATYRDNVAQRYLAGSQVQGRSQSEASTSARA